MLILLCNGPNSPATIRRAKGETVRVKRFFFSKKLFTLDSMPLVRFLELKVLGGVLPVFLLLVFVFLGCIDESEIHTVHTPDERNIYGSTLFRTIPMST